jgi:spore coat protein U-like protein
MKRFRLVALAVSAALGVFGLASRHAAVAATQTSTFQVQATVVSSCTIATTGINFTNYDPVVANHTTPLDANGTVTVACTSGAATTIGMNQGSNQAATSTAALPKRQMASGATNRVSYDLYQDTLHTTVWGDVGTGAAMTYNSTSMAAQTFNIYGRMVGGQDVATGAYTDTVTATIQF